MKCLRVYFLPARPYNPRCPIPGEIPRHRRSVGLFERLQSSLARRRTDNRRDTRQPGNQVEVVLAGHISADERGCGEECGKYVEECGADAIPVFLGFCEEPGLDVCGHLVLVYRIQAYTASDLKIEYGGTGSGSPAVPVSRAL